MLLNRLYLSLNFEQSSYKIRLKLTRVADIDYFGQYFFDLGESFIFYTHIYDTSYNLLTMKPILIY
jgi:hypothetical protein